MKKKVVITGIMVIVVAIMSVVACIKGCGPNPLDPEAYRKLSEKKWVKIYKVNSPTWRVEDKVREDVEAFKKCGEKERRRLFKELQKEVED